MGYSEQRRSIGPRNTKKSVFTEVIPIGVAFLHPPSERHTPAFGLASIKAPLMRAADINTFLFRQGWVHVTSAFAEMASSAPGLRQTSQSNYRSFSNTPETVSDSGSDDDVAIKSPLPQRRLSTAVDAPLPPHIAEPDATVKIIYTILGAATLLSWNGAPCFGRSFGIA